MKTEIAILLSNMKIQAPNTGKHNQAGKHVISKKKKKHKKKIAYKSKKQNRR